MQKKILSIVFTVLSASIFGQSKEGKLSNLFYAHNKLMYSFRWLIILFLSAALPAQSQNEKCGQILLKGNDVFSATLNESGLDKLTDETGKFVLGALPYSESFLEPFMPADVLKLHYTAHHGGAVNTANKATGLINKALENGNFEGVDYWTKKLSLHLSSHVLHTIFWTNITNKKSEPTGELLKRIEKDFGSFDKMKVQLAHHSKNVDGNGWGLLGFHPQSNRLMILEVENHEKLTVWGIVPLMVVDVWEHAYYLKYKNKRADFVDELFNYMNWDNAAQRLDIALKMTR